MNILITGSGGFIAKEIIHSLKASNKISAFSTSLTKNSEDYTLMQIDSLEEIKIEHFQEIDIFIHTANIAHKKLTKSTISEIEKINYDQTIRLFKLAARSAVKRIIFLSSVAVYGRSSEQSSFNENSPTNPHNDYGVYKLKSEISLKEICKDTITDFTILRMPMVIGKNAPGSSRLLSNFLKKRIFFPIPILDNSNKRTLCNYKYVGRAIKEIVLTSTSPEILNICNSDAISTYDIIRSFSNPKNKFFRIKINRPMHELFKCIPYFGRLYNKGYSNFEISSLYLDQFVRNETDNTMNQIRSFYK